MTKKKQNTGEIISYIADIFWAREGTVFLLGHIC